MRRLQIVDVIRNSFFFEALLCINVMLRNSFFYIFKSKKIEFWLKIMNFGIGGKLLNNVNGYSQTEMIHHQYYTNVLYNLCDVLHSNKWKENTCWNYSANERHTPSFIVFWCDICIRVYSEKLDHFLAFDRNRMKTHIDC